MNFRGSGRNQGNRMGAGPGGNCICPKCGYEKAHIRNIPCFVEKCHKCGARMVRKYE